jgi:hypothetical protein
MWLQAEDTSERRERKWRESVKHMEAGILDDFRSLLGLLWSSVPILFLSP